MMANFLTADEADYAWEPLEFDVQRGNNDVYYGYVPDGAVLAGNRNGKPSFVGRVEHNGHWEVANLGSGPNDKDGFAYAYYGVEYFTTKGEVLVALKNGQEPVWISSGFGEHINEAISIQSDHHHQLVGRIWHEGRWIPAKINSEWGLCHFSFEGKEYARRHYQVLLGNLKWQKVAKSPPRLLVPVDNMSPVSLENCVHHADSGWQGDRPDGWKLDGKKYRLVQKTSDECKWVVSGDGEAVRNAVMIHIYQIGRVRSPAGAEWLHGYVQPCGGEGPGLYVGKHRYPLYQVLTANCNRQQAFSVQLFRGTEGKDNKLTSPEGKDNKLTSPNEVFLLTKTAKGESADMALQDMLSKYQACQIAESL